MLLIPTVLVGIYIIWKIGKESGNGFDADPFLI